MKCSKLFALLIIFTLSGLQMASAQVTEKITTDKETRKEALAKELNLSEKQAADLEKLKSEAQVERGKMHDRHRTEKEALHDNYDRKLKTILDEKQYYAFKAKVKKHGKKMKKHGRKKNHHRQG